MLAESAWLTYGRVLIECAALCVARPSAGAVLTGEEMTALTGSASPPAPATPAATPAEVRESFRPHIERAWQALVGEDAPLQRLSSAWELLPPDIATLAVCGAVEWDRRLAQLCAAANGHDATTHVTVDLLREIIGDGALEALKSSVLHTGCLVEIDEAGPLDLAEVRLARSTAWALAGINARDSGLSAGTELRDANVTTPAGAETDMMTEHRYPRIAVASPDPERRAQTVAAHLDAAAFLIAPPPTTAPGWQALLRQATNGILGIALDLTAEKSTGDPAVRRSTVDADARQWISRASHLPWAICSADPLSTDQLPNGNWVGVSSAPSEVSDTEWSSVFPGAPLPRRRPTATQLALAARAVEAEKERADENADETQGVSTSLTPDPQRVLQRVAGATLLRHATRIRPRETWGSLILPPAQLSQLHGLVDRYRYRSTVHEKWKLPLYPSPGVVALFAGPSGTGKTTAAQVIASELGVDMFRVDLSALVSKFIGETEKNLEELFTAAHTGEFLLLFDEADALFSHRSEVSDARDRYANMETAYLLQRIESFDGFVILTSNFQGNIDEAFLRRIHVSVPFTVPEVADRERIWERCLADAPRGDMDLHFVAEQFDLAGGSIRLAALSAATFAAARGGPIEMVDILRAVEAEMTKLRRRTHVAQFGPWQADMTA